MSEAYMSMLIASQEKKLELLKRAIELDKEQEEIITGDKPDMGALDANMDAKGALIDELDKLDDGFEALYDVFRCAHLDVAHDAPRRAGALAALAAA